jgi:lipocalin
MADKALRLALVKELSEKGFKLGKKAFNEDAKYSRFYSHTIKVDDTGDEEEVRSAVSELFNRAKVEFPRGEVVLRDVFGEPKT